MKIPGRCLLPVCAGFVVVGSVFAAPPQDVEARAQETALLFNAEVAPKMVEGPTLAARAVAQGKQVIYTYTVRREAAFAPEMIERFKFEYDTVILGIACSGHARDEAFRNGLSYLSVFQDEKGERMHELVVDQRACAKL